MHTHASHLYDSCQKRSPTRTVDIHTPPPSKAPTSDHFTIHYTTGSLEPQ